MLWITKNLFRRTHRQKFRSVNFCLFQQHRPGTAAPIVRLRVRYEGSSCRETLRLARRLMTHIGRVARNLINGRYEREFAMTKVRVAGFSISLDGFGAGPEQSLENPLGK